MHAKEQGNFARSQGVRMTDEMLQRLRVAAREAGMKPGIWIRHIIGAALDGDSKLEELVKKNIAETVALRTVILTLETPQWRTGEFTEQQLRDMVMKVDARKSALAEAVMEEGKQ